MRSLCFLPLAAAVVCSAPVSLAAQGRCIRAYGTPACNTDPIPPVFAKTGWRTTGLDHITWRVADAKTEAAFYAALMGWKVRSEEPTRVVMDIGEWGTAIFRQVSADSFPATGRGRASSLPLRAVVEGIGFDIAPWNAKTVEAELRKRGLNPTPENGPNGFESFHVKDPDGFDVQIGNGKGYSRARAQSPANARLSIASPFESTGWQTVWLDHLSYGATNYKASVSFYVNLLGWQPTYDEGSQNELMIGDVGDIIIRGGNPLDPAFGKGSVRAGGRIDHISFGISPWDTDRVKDELVKRGLPWTIDTSDGAEIHVAQFKASRWGSASTEQAVSVPLVFRWPPRKGESSPECRDFSSSVVSVAFACHTRGPRGRRRRPHPSWVRVSLLSSGNGDALATPGFPIRSIHSSAIIT